MDFLDPGATGRRPGVNSQSDRPSNFGPRGPPIEPLGLRINDAARALGVCRSTIYNLAAAGKIKIIRIGGRSIVDFASLKALFDTEEAAS
jgi:excisionase family DNA binding protein